MKSKRLMAIIMSVAVCISLLGMTKFSTNNVVKADTQTVQAPSNITRLDGTDRYDTSAKIAQYGWKQADTVFIAGAENNNDFADAIAGTPLAHAYDAPILLTRVSALPDDIRAEITSLTPKNIVILGGTGVVSQGIEDGLKAKGYNVTRIAGQTRYDTAIQIAKELWNKYPSTNDKVGSDTSVILTTGKQFQYAMSVASTAGNTAILYSDGDTLNYDVENLIAGDKNIQSIDTIGGSKVLEVKGDLYNGNLSLFNIDNCNNITELKKDEGFLENYNGVAVASDTIFPDALSGSALAAKLGYKLVLSNGKDFPYTVDSTQNHLSGGLIFGGTQVMSDSMTSKISAILNKNIPANPNGLKDSDIIPFADDGFKRDAEQALGKTNITLADAKKATSLTLYQNSSDGGYQINDLSDIKYFSGIYDLDLEGGKLPQNIGAINSLYKLEGLYLEKCTFNQSDISTISKNIKIVSDGKKIN
ncbi:cell wall-binding repeat-containing protein [Clostridium ljungdahlii]|uniref:N-acetylmuramoyl-L-alanine amidase LytC n=1 Tax=Clostridium ljungdahlii TaxID=1538 RepID=A0A166RGT7_9CLOT|nr:cell wall-binding repeat-containing protein [Clostridium ljungdahlii]OAA90787.1 N-acetylmuramoyl-L-alanine amidase LytC precursor [Clostridium ljungdahlii]